MYAPKTGSSAVDPEDALFCLRARLVSDGLARTGYGGRGSACVCCVMAVSSRVFVGSSRQSFVEFDRRGDLEWSPRVDIGMVGDERVDSSGAASHCAYLLSCRGLTQPALFVYEPLPNKARTLSICSIICSILQPSSRRNGRLEPVMSVRHRSGTTSTSTPRRDRTPARCDARTSSHPCPTLGV
jgi:hypothetical protein